MYRKRIQTLLAQVKTSVVYITSPENLLYYSGFTGGEGTLVLTKETFLLFTDSRYLIQAAEEAPDFSIIDIAELTASDYLAKEPPESIAFEGSHVTATEYEQLQEKLSRTRWESASCTILNLRAVKDEQEQAFTRHAAMLADKAFEHVLPMIRPGISELDVALELEWHMRKNGASAASFPIVCASGVRSAMPHGVATEKKLETGDFLTMDFGCLYHGYASDMTRTVVLGKASDEQKRIYNTVLKAQETALAAVSAGKTGKEIDAVARTIIADGGYGPYFGHALGHGTGLEIHERPVLSPKTEDVLTIGMLVTVEPGIYVPDLGGVRIEDLVIVTKESCENLTHSTKALLEL